MERASLHLREVDEGDRELLFEWANDPAVRASSFSPGPIEWGTHVAWLEAKLNDPDCRLYLACGAEGEPIGQIRFDLASDGSAEVDVHTAPGWRGRGRGGELIAAGVERLFGATGVTLVHAYVKRENRPSSRAFEKAGFALAGEEMIQGCRVLHFVLPRP